MNMKRMYIIKLSTVREKLEVNEGNQRLMNENLKCAGRTRGAEQRDEKEKIRRLDRTENKLGIKKTRGKKGFDKANLKSQFNQMRYERVKCDHTYPLWCHQTSGSVDVHVVHHHVLLRSYPILHKIEEYFDQIQKILGVSRI